MSYEQRKDLSQNDGLEERFERLQAQDPEVLSKEQYRKDQEEQVMEYQPTSETPVLREKLVEAKKTEVEKIIDQAMKSRPDGTDEYESTKPEHFDQEVKVHKQVSGLKKLSLVLGMFFAGLAGAKAGDRGTKDSLDSKMKTVRNIERSETVTDSDRQAWNDYSAWLGTKGMRGNPALDKGGLGYKYFDEYVRTHKTTLNREILSALSKELSDLRTVSLSNIQRGEGVFHGKKESFMASVDRNNKTKHPEYPGSNMTLTIFPHIREITKEAKNLNTQQIGTETNNLYQKTNDIKETIKNVGYVDEKIIKIEDKGFVKSKSNKHTDIARN